MRQNNPASADFAARFHMRYAAFSSVWKALAEGDTPENLPAEWKSINYYAHVLSDDSDARVKKAAQAFLNEVEIARLDPRTRAERLALATQALARVICDEAGIAWKDDRAGTEKPAAKKSQAGKAKKTRRSTPAK